MTAYLIVNFGGPRSLKEIEPFLKALLTDRDVVRTKLPTLFHNYLFKKIAKKRSLKVAKDYEAIGGGSPIHADTEAVAEYLRKRLKAPVLTFHRYIPATHKATLEALEALEVEEIRVFPMFPQFTYATTGSIARYFSKHLSDEVLNKMRWVKSYPAHSAFIGATQNAIREFMEKHRLEEEKSVLLFSAHGLPKAFVEEGDLYLYECELSYERVMAAFPRALGRLAFQSKFGPGEWLRPYTQDVCEEILEWSEGRKHVIFVPISFTSDHIETLFEIENEYLPIVKKAGLNAYRLPALNRRADWLEAIVTILSSYTPSSTPMLIR